MDCEIIQGDCLDVIPTLPDNINCIVADPPYGVNFVSQRAATPEGKKHVRAIANDADLDTAIALFEEVAELLAAKTADEAEFYVFTRWDIVGPWIEAVKRIPGFQYKMLLVWDKGIPGMGDIDCNWGCGHEIILYCKKGRREMPFRRSGIIHVDKLGSKQHVHPTEKPVPLIQKLIEMSTNPGDLVVDPFSGSGSTTVAAQRLGRRGIGIEIDPHYVEISRRRLGDMSFDL